LRAIRRGYGVAPPGRRTVNTEPLPGSLATVTSPPIMRASLRERAAARVRRSLASLSAPRSFKEHLRVEFLECGGKCPLLAIQFVGLGISGRDRLQRGSTTGQRVKRMRAARGLEGGELNVDRSDALVDVGYAFGVLSFGHSISPLGFAGASRRLLGRQHRLDQFPHHHRI
jgi:hypothetical protein